MVMLVWTVSFIRVHAYTHTHSFWRGSQQLGQPSRKCYQDVRRVPHLRHERRIFAHLKGLPEPSANHDQVSLRTGELSRQFSLLKLSVYPWSQGPYGEHIHWLLVTLIWLATDPSVAGSYCRDCIRQSCHCVASLVITEGPQGGRTCEVSSCLHVMKSQTFSEISGLEMHWWSDRNKILKHTA